MDQCGHVAKKESQVFINLIQSSPWDQTRDIKNMGELTGNSDNRGIRFNISLGGKFTRKSITVTFTFKQGNFSQMRGWARKTGREHSDDQVIKLRSGGYIREAQVESISDQERDKQGQEDARVINQQS